MANRTKRLSSSKRSASVFRFEKFGDIKKTVDSRISSLKIKKRYKNSVAFAQKKPFTSFFIVLGALLLVIVLGSTIFSVKSPKIEGRTIPKNVDVYRLGASPRISVQGEVKKGGVVKIMAQAPGIVNSINTLEGATVEKGTILLNLASNYEGANAFTLQRQLAGTTYQNTKDTYDIQSGLITRQRDLATRQSENSEEMRKLTRTSIDETRNLININGEIIRGLQNAINSDPAGSAVEQGQLAQVQAGQNQLQAALRASEYQVNPTGPAIDLEKIGRDVALAQLDLQEKALKFGLEVSGIQFRLAQVQESTMYPSSPFASVVQKIHVKVGDSINPGTLLATLAGDAGDVVIDAKVPKEIAEKVSKIEKASINIDGKKIDLMPSYVSTEATDGQLYSVLFTLPTEYQKLFTDSSFVSVSLPIGESIGTTIPFVPVDSVFQTQDEAFVFVVDGGKAQSRKVKLGPVTGSYVTIEQGLTSRDQVILNRTVIDGDSVKIQN